MSATKEQIKLARKSFLKDRDAALKRLGIKKKRKK